MATKYIDVSIAGGKQVTGIVVQDTSTVTNHVRVAWDTGVSRFGLATALQQIAREVLMPSSVPAAAVTDAKGSIDGYGG